MTNQIFNEPLIIETGKKILARNETLAVAESVTSGLLQAAFSLVPDASKFLQGGITAYNLGQKYRHLLIEPIHAEQCNCVSGKIAEQMAMHVCDMFSSHWGLGITGYAAPVPESGDKLFAYYAIAYKGKIVAADIMKPQEDETPFNVQLFYTNQLAEALSKQVGQM